MKRIKINKVSTKKISSIIVLMLLAISFAYLTLIKHQSLIFSFSFILSVLTITSIIVIPIQYFINKKAKK